MKTALAIFGGFILTLTILGSLNIGHFRLYYGAENLVCTKQAAE